MVVAAAGTTRAIPMGVVAREAPEVLAVATKDPAVASITRAEAIMVAASTMEVTAAEATAATRVVAGQGTRIICKATDSTITRAIRTTAANISKTWAAALKAPRR